MKIGDRVKVIGIFGQDKIDTKYIGMTGVINNISSGDEYPYEISFDDGFDNNFTEDELELVNSKFSIGDRVRVNSNYYINNIQNLEGTVVVINASIGVEFNREYSGLHTLEGYLKSLTGRWFHESEISLISKSIPISKDLINKKEIMNEEIERVLREGDAAMKMHDKGKIKVVFTSFDVPNMLASVTKVKCSNDDTTIHQIKKRARKVGYIAHRLKI